MLILYIICLTHAGPCIRHHRIIMLSVLVIFKHRIDNNGDTIIPISHIFVVNDGFSHRLRRPIVLEYWILSYTNSCCANLFLSSRIGVVIIMCSKYRKNLVIVITDHNIMYNIYNDSIGSSSECNTRTEFGGNDLFRFLVHGCWTLRTVSTLRIKSNNSDGKEKKICA